MTSLAEPPLRTSFDPNAHKLAGFLESPSALAIESKVRASLAISAFSRSNFPRRPISGEEASGALQHYIHELTLACTSQAQQLSSARWLWYTRRCPTTLFRGRLRTTEAYDSALMDAFTWLSTRQEASPASQPIAFPVNERVAQILIRLVASVRLLSHAHVVYRLAGKGASVINDHFVPMANTPPTIRQAVDLYDLRHDERRNVSFQSLGLAGDQVTLENINRKPNKSDNKLWLFHRCEEFQAPAPVVSQHGEVIEAEIDARYMCDLLDLVALLRPFPTSEETPYLQTMEPLVTLLLLVPALIAERPWAFSAALQNGYFAIQIDALMDAVKTFIPVVTRAARKINPHIKWTDNANNWFERLDKIGPALWPLRPGGIFRKAGGAVFIDVATASSAILHLAEIDRTRTDLGNHRSKQFELQTQALLDQSEWSPTSALRELRGRPLRRNGKAITDIDAVGERDGVLLLVSCKSVIYDRLYDQGDYKTVRNAASLVDEAVEAWQQQAADITNAPGDNFDFSGYRTSIPVVCTPFVVYTTNTHSNASISGELRAAASFEELQSWAGAEKSVDE